MNRLALSMLLIAGCAADEVGEVEQAEGNTGVSSQEFPLADPLNRVFAPLNTASQTFFAGTCLVRLKDKPEEELPEESDVPPNTVTAQLKIHYAQNRSSVDKSFGISGSLEASYGLASGKAELKASNESKVATESVYLTAELNAVVKQSVAANCPLAISKSNTALLMTDQGMGDDPALLRAARFMKGCGNTYVHLESRGLIATIELSISHTEASHKNELEAAISAKFGTPLTGISATAALKSVQQQFAGKLRIDATLVTAGFTPTVTREALGTDPGATLEKLLREAQEFAQSKGAINTMVPISARLGYYPSLEPFRGRFAKNGMDRIYTDEQIKKFTDALAKIKPLAAQMDAFLTPRRELRRELDVIQKQVEYIGTTEPERFSYSGSQKSFDGTTALPQYRDKADDFPDIVKYPPVAKELAKKLTDETEACVEDAENGFAKCKEGEGTPAAGQARDFVKKWRANRPRPMAVGFTANLGSGFDGITECKNIGAVMLGIGYAKLARHLILKQMKTRGLPLAAFVDPPTANRCPADKPIWFGKLYHPGSNELTDNCAAVKPGPFAPAACVLPYEYRGSKKVTKPLGGEIWHDAFFGDELVIP